MAYAMADLGWKFYFINAAWDFVFLIIAYFVFVETKGLKLEEIDAKFQGTVYIQGIIQEDVIAQHGRLDSKVDAVVSGSEQTRI
jgi:hypothetical protein